MRIALVTSHTGETFGLARALARHKHDVTVYVRRDAAHLGERERSDDGYQVVRVPAGPARPLSPDTAWRHTDEFTRLLRREWGESTPDVAHSHGTMAGLAALLAAREHAVPVVHTHREPDPERERVDRLICRHAAHVVATSTAEVADLCRMGVPRSRITVVPTGVDLDDRETPGPLEHGTGRVTVLGVGELRPGHGFDTAVTAMADVRDAVLVIAAPVERNDRKSTLEANRLRRLAQEVGVEDRVQVIGPAARSEAVTLLGSADIVVTVPWQDPSGVVALEAMAHSRPVIASDVGALADAVVDEITGRLVPPGDVPALVHALRELVANDAKREAFGIAGADRVRARYGWDRVSADAVRVYQHAQFSRV
jgi:glycosyltransferase involved in cell wall biosynthesis